MIMNVSPTAPAALLLAHQQHPHTPPDPGGLNPDGIVFMAGEEPTGRLMMMPIQTSPRHFLKANYGDEVDFLDGQDGDDDDDDVSPKVQPPPTPARRNSTSSAAATTSTTPVMALLMASPPPPPKMSMRKSLGCSTSPTKKSLPMSPRSTKSLSILSTRSPISPDGATTSSSTRSRSSSSSSTTPRLAASGTVSTRSTTSSSSSSARSPATESIVERRLKAARAIYSSEKLALGHEADDPPVGDPPVGDKQLGRHSMQGTPVHQHHEFVTESSVNNNCDDSPRSSKSSSSSLSRKQKRKSQQQQPEPSTTIADLDASISCTPDSSMIPHFRVLASPMSQATEPHSNSTQHYLEQHRNYQHHQADAVGTAAPAATTTPASRTGGGVVAGIGLRLAQTPERLSRVLTPERRRMSDQTDAEPNNGRPRVGARTPERRRNSTPIATIAPSGGAEGSEQQQQQLQPHGKKKGFFRKLFRGIKKKGSSSSSFSEPGGGSMAIVEETATIMSLESPKRTTASKSSSSSSSASSSAGTPKKKLPLVNDDERDDESGKSMPRVNVKKQQQEHDATVKANLSAESEGDEDGESRDHRPQRDVFFHDDVSTLTGPTYDDLENKGGSSSRRKNWEPVETASVRNSTSHTSDPMGHYFHFQQSSEGKQPTPRASLVAEVDPFTEALFDHLEKEEETENESDAASTNPRIAKKASDLRVDIVHRYDPVGESPLSSRRKEASDTLLQQDENAQKSLMPDPSPQGQQTPLLRVKAELEKSSTIQDPSPRGYKTPSFRENTTLDPLGESPMHKHQRGPTAVVNGQPMAPDPPFFVDEASLEQEEEADTKGEEVVDGDIEGDKKTDKHAFLLSAIGVAPPPPPPPPRTITVPSLPSTCPPPPPPLPRQPSFGKGRPPSPGNSRPSPDPRQEQRHHQAESPNRVATEHPDRVTANDKAIHRMGKSLVDDLSVDTRNNTEAKPSPNSESSGISSNSSSAGFAFFDSDTGERTKAVSVTNHVVSKSRTSRGTTTQEKMTVRSKVIVEETQAKEETEESPERAEAEEENEDQSKSGSQSKKSFISSVARMNAKAVAYLHTLNGEPSPRRAWLKPSLSEEEASPVGAVGVGRNINFSVNSGFSLNVVKDRKRSQKKPTPNQHNRVSEEEQEGDAVMKLFQAYSGRFKGRKLTSKPPSPRLDAEPTKEKPTPTVPAWQSRPLDRNVTVTSKTVTVGYAQLRLRREVDIASGKKVRVIPGKKRGVPKVKSFFQPRRDMEPKDPIQRAGRRLLSKAAVPIQSSARRFLAQREAVDRMWALIEIQSYLRRWRAEANLLASRCMAVKIQKSFRGFSARRELDKMTEAAIHIQRMIRGYLAAAYAFDTVYSVILTQAQGRGFLVRKQLAEHTACATCIQTRYRGYKARMLLERNSFIVGKIQTTWRKYSARRRYQFALVDIIISQSIVRSWFARRELANRRHAFRNEMITKIQAVWRGFQAYTDYIFCMVDIIVIQRTARRHQAQTLAAKMRQENAALMIQAHWRMTVKRNDFHRHQAAVQLQSSWRMKKAKHLLQRERAAVKIQALYRMKAGEGLRRRILSAIRIQTIWRMEMQRNRLQQERSAVKIQARVRTHRAQVKMLYDLVHIIMVQSVARRYISQFRVSEQQKTLSKGDAAIRIQAAWRGFWNYSHYIIMQFEAGIIQSMMRGALTRKQQKLRLGRCIMIQSAARRYIATKKVRQLIDTKEVIDVRAKEMREKLACKHIQFWWRVVMTCRKEKAAALVIERFFMMVKEEVEREIRRYEKKKQSSDRNARRGRRRRYKKESDDNVLERVWLNTVDDCHVDVFALSHSPSYSVSGVSTQLTVASSSVHSGSSSSKLNRKAGSDRSIRHRASSPTMNLVMRHEYEPKKGSSGKESDSLAFSASGDASSLASQSYTSRRSRSSSSRQKQTRAELTEDLALEEAFLDAHLQQDRIKQRAAEKYLERYGIKPGRVSTTTSAASSTQFSSDDQSASSSIKRDRTGITQASTFRSAAAATTSSSSSSMNEDPVNNLHQKKGSGVPPKHSRDSPRHGVSPRHGASPRHGESPRHGKILVMNPYPADNYITRKESRPAVEEEEEFYGGEEFGMI